MTSSDALKRSVESGSPTLGAMVATHSPSMVEVYGGIGLDFAWIDLEHKGPSGNDGSTIDAFARAGDAAGIPLLVRLPDSNPTMIQTVLNAGIQNVLVSDVETADDVEGIVRSTRFEYGNDVGGRGASFSRSNGWGAPGPDYVADEDGSKCVGVMIENRTAVENIDEIVSVPDLDFVRIGAADLSIALGHPYETDHPAVREHVERVEDVCRETGTTLSKKVTNPEDVVEAIGRGYTLLTIGRDIRIVRDVLTGRQTSFRREIDAAE